MGLFDAIKGAAEAAKDMGINALLSSQTALDTVNGYVGRYAEVKSIRKVDGGFEFTAQPKGSAELVAVTAKDIVVADDNSTVKVGSVSASMEWVENALKDFVQGREYVVPEASRGLVGNAKKFM